MSADLKKRGYKCNKMFYITVYAQEFPNNFKEPED
jgi:hypothetical protein